MANNPIFFWHGNKFVNLSAVRLVEFNDELTDATIIYVNGDPSFRVKGAEDVYRLRELLKLLTTIPTE